MSKRRYKSSCSKFSIHLNLKQGEVILDFKGRDVFTKERYFDTEDKEVQQALEETTAFGVYFYLSDIFESEEREEDVHKPIDEEMEFPSVKEAKEFLNQTHSIPFHRLTNLVNIEKEYLAKGIKLVITQKK